jgi:hypothetical protein
VTKQNKTKQNKQSITKSNSNTIFFILSTHSWLSQCTFIDCKEKALDLDLGLSLGLGLGLGVGLGIGLGIGLFIPCVLVCLLADPPSCDLLLRDISVVCVSQSESDNEKSDGCETPSVECCEYMYNALELECLEWPSALSSICESDYESLNHYYYTNCIHGRTVNQFNQFNRSVLLDVAIFWICVMNECVCMF